MTRQPPRSTRTDTRFPYTTLFCSRLISWSISKSITAVLAGLMVSDGRLVPDAPAPVPAWSQPGDPRGEITLRQLLHMSSGLEHIESGEPVYDSDTVRMLFLSGANDMAAYEEERPLSAQPSSEEHTYELQSLMRTSY